MQNEHTTNPSQTATDKSFRFLSLFSGIEAASQAWLPLGWECAAVAEIEPFPSAVLRHHYPEVPNLGDVTKITEQQIKQLGHIDLVVGGFPCQDLSVAGKRKGLTNADGTFTRSGLFFTGFQIFQWAKQHCGATKLLIENVPGLFSSNKGADFAAVVEHMAGLEGVRVPAQGWGTEGVAVGNNGLLEWCTIDAQWFGLSQRRKRVFALLDTGDWANRPPILLEPESLRGNTPPSREKGERVAATLSARTTGGGGLGTDFECDGGLIPDVCGTLSDGAHHGGGLNGQDAYSGRIIPVAHSLRGEGFDASEDGTGRGTPLVPVAYRTNAAGQVDDQGECTAALTTMTDPTTQFIAFTCKDHGADAGDQAPTLRAMGHAESHANAGGQLAVAYPLDLRNAGRDPEKHDEMNRQGVGVGNEGDPSGTVSTAFTPGVATTTAVRRLTPEECETLQGFSQMYTAIPWRGKQASECPDGPRYKALGNSFAVPCVAWIGRRIQMVEDLMNEVAA